MPPPAIDAVSEMESPVAAGTPPSWKSMDALLLTFTVPGLGAVGSMTGVPELVRRSYVTLETTAPPGSVSAKPTVPAASSGLDGVVELDA